MSVKKREDYWEIQRADTFAQKLLGLIPFQGKKKNWKKTMLFSPCHSIHTFFMRRKIDVAFLDEHGRVVKTKRGLGPHRITSCLRAHACLERFSSPEPWLSVNQKPIFYEKFYQKPRSGSFKKDAN